MKLLSAATSLSTSILIVSLYCIFHSIPLGFEVFFKILPDSDVYISSQDIEGIIAYFACAVIGLGLIFFAKKNPDKKIRNLIIFLVSALLIIGFQVAKTLHGAQIWHYEWNYYWDEWLKDLMIDMLPFTFLLLGFMIYNGALKASLLLTVIFSSLCLYHLFLAANYFKVFGRAFSTISSGNLIFVIIIAVCSLAFAYINLMSFKQLNLHKDT